MFFTNILYFYHRKILPGFRPKKNDLVIDIGSGDKPFWRANVFLDNLSLDNLQRSTYGDTVKGLGNFVNGDITKTQFKNKVFDFSFCSHLLEHVEKPDLVIQEIVRISKAGYIEVPNGLMEYIQPFPTHLWFVFISKNKLLFIRKGERLHQILTQNSENFPHLLSKVNSPFIRFYWKKEIEYEIVDSGNTFKKFFPPSIKKKGKKTLKKNSFEEMVSQKGYVFFIKLMRKLYTIENSVPLKQLLNN